MLVKFCPLAGRYSNDALSIQCNDDGVEYVESKVNTDLAENLHQGPEIELLDDLLPWRVPPNPALSSSPLLGIQVNKFNCGGLVMGLQISHFIADAFTIGTFVGEWAHITKTGRKTECLPSFGQLSTLIFAMNLRRRTKLPPSSELVLGNFCTGGIATLKANHSRGELNDFVSIVKSASRDTSSYIGEASVEDVSSMFARGFSLSQMDEMDLYLCSSWCRLPWYEVDFGWGKPSWVIPISEDTDRSIVLMDTKDGDGIEVWVSLNENDMVELEKHPDILKFCQG